MAASPPTVYVTQQQQQMLDAWENGGYCSLAESILDMEKNYSRQINESRIINQTQYMSHAIMLLSQHEALIPSILGNCLIERIKDGTVALDPRSKIIYANQRSGDVACGLYINYLLDPRGRGLTVTEYEEFVGGMIACIENRLMRSHRLGFNIDQAATAYFLSYTGRAKNEIPNMRKSCSGKTNLQDFKTSQAALIADAKAQNATEIRVPGEAGFSINVHTRCYEHDKLQGSANFFRLARCVLNALWPARKFILHSVYVFQAFNVEQVEYGEGVATHLVGGYPTYGGLNFTQAGMQIQSTKMFGHTRWRQMAPENQATGVVMTTNINSEMKELKKKIEKDEELVDRNKRYLKLNALISEINETLQDISEDQQNKELAKHCEEEMDSMRKYIDHKERETQRILNSVKKFARAVGAAKAVPQYTQMSEGGSFGSESYPRGGGGYDGDDDEGGEPGGEAGGEHGGDDDDGDNDTEMGDD